MRKTPSFRSKLWVYFILFAGIIFALLWLLQTVGLQGFYDRMMKQNIREAAQQIVDNSQDDDLEDLIDRLSFEDSLLVYITGEDGEVYYSSDAYKPYFRPMNRQGTGFAFDRADSRRRSDEDDFRQAGFRTLPTSYERFLSELEKSESGKVEFTFENSFIYGCRITLADEQTALLYVAGTLGAVGAAASIIRVQLLWVTVLSLALSFVIAWVIARRFAKPIDQLSEQAKMLGGDHYEDRFQKGFCRELDDLDESLNQSAEKLSEAREYQKELLANVSHDLRTPLTMIKGYAEMVRDISWEDEEQRTNDTGVIIREADRMTALVNEILEYSRLQENDPALTLTDVDLSALTNEVADRFEPLFRQEGGTIERKIEPGCVVQGDAELLERVVFNLVDNAVRHTGKEEKRITISVQRDERVRLAVRDNGEGIDPADLPHIWEKYYTTRQRGGKGVSGLGLAIVKRAAALLNAEVDVKSVRGEGSEFSFVM